MLKKALFLSFLPVFGMIAFATPARAQTASSSSQCEPATVEMVFRNDQGEFIPNLNFELYEQLTNADGYPAPGKKVVGGKTDQYTGKGKASYTPKANAEGGYGLMIKVYDRNQSVGEFWYASEIYLSCGESKSLEKKLSGIRFIFRDGEGKLKKNFKFSLYTQKYDADNKPIRQKEALVSSALDTGETGQIIIYLTDQSHVLRGIGGDYAVAASPAGEGNYIEYYLHVNAERTTTFEYTLSGALLSLAAATGEPLPSGKTVELYKQEQDAKGKPMLGKNIKKLTIDTKGQARFDFQEGTYALAFKDDSGKNYLPFYNLKLSRGKLLSKKLTVGVVRLFVMASDGQAMPEKTIISVYDLVSDNQGKYYRNKKLVDLKISVKGYAETSLAPGSYLFVFKEGKIEYGRAYTVGSGGLQTVTLKAGAETTSVASQPVVFLASSVKGLGAKLKGQILLQVEALGEAWYVWPDDARRYYMADGDAAYEIMRRLGLGVTNENLEKIPIGYNAKAANGDLDTDADGLANKLEETIHTDPYNSDSDGDNVSDGDELKAGTDPLGQDASLAYDTALVSRLKGKILLQVEAKGEAWYLNPKDGKRYYLADGAAAYQIMKYLSLGINDNDLDTIEEGVLD